MYSEGRSSKDGENHEREREGETTFGQGWGNQRRYVTYQLGLALQT